MKKIQYTLLFFVLLSASPIKTFAQPFVEFIAQSTDVDCQTSTVSIDLDVANFTQMNSFDFSFHWDPNVLTLTSPNINNTGLIPAVNIFDGGIATGTLTFSWFSIMPGGTTVPGGSGTIATFTFDVIGNASQFSDFTFDDTPTFINVAQNGSSLDDTQYTFTEGILNITDSESPTLSTCPMDQTIDTGGATTAQVSGAGVTAMDNCGVDSIGYVITGATNVTGSGDVSNNVDFEIGMNEVTYTAYDFVGNTSTTCVFNVEVINSITPPGDLAIYTNNPTVNCENNTVSVDILADNFTDMIGAEFDLIWNTTSLEYIDTSNIVFTTGIVAFGTSNITNGELEFSWSNFTPPLDLPNGTVLFTINFNINAPAGLNIPFLFELGTDEFTTSTSFPVALDPSTYSVTNGNIFIFDNEPPTISCVPNVVVTSTNGTDAIVNNIEPTTSDNCGIVDTVYTLTDQSTSTIIGGGTGDASGTTFPLGTTIVEYTVTDFDGNTSDCSFNITVQEPGVITVTIDSIEVSCENTTAIVGFKVKNFTDVTGLAFTIEWDETELTYNGIVQDNLDPDGVAGITQIADGILTYSWNGFSNPNSFMDDEDIIFIEFQILNPNIGMIEDITFVPGPVAFEISTVGSFPFNLPTSQTEAINGAIEIIDQTDPVFIDCPMNVSMEANGASSVVVNMIGATATDNCGTPTVTYALSTTPSVTGSGDVSGFSFPAGETTTVIYTATDGAGNTAVCSFTVTITQDPLTIQCPMSITQNNDTGECDAAIPAQPITISSDILNIQSVTYDITGATVTNGTGDIPALTYNVGTSTVTYTVMDVFGATEVCSFTITIADIEGPEFSNVPVNITIECDEIVPNATPLATDECDGAVTVILTSQTTDPGTVPGSQIITRTWTASDMANNESMVSQTITILDTENPTISCPGSVTINAVSTAPGVCEGMANWIEPTTTDNCDMDLFVSSTHSSGSFFPVGVTEVTYFVEDDAGNRDSCKFNVTVIDVTPPTLTCPMDITVNAVSSGPGICEGIATWTTLVASDECDNAPIVSCTHNSGDFFPLGTTEVTCYATDASGNLDSCKFNVIVEDMEAPTITDCPIDITVMAGASCFAPVSWAMPTVMDNCDANPTFSCNIASGSNFSAGTTPIICTATDAAGNESTCMFNVIVVDEVPPSIFCPVDVSVSTNGTISDPNQTPFITSVTPAGCDSIEISFDTPASFDNCSVPTIVQTLGLASGEKFGLGTHIIQFVATDGSTPGNTDTCEVVINVTPTIGITVNVDPDSLCTSGDAQLSVSGGFSMTATFSWTGPNGYQAFIQNPPVTNVALVDSGFYVVSVFEPTNGCTIVDSVFLAVTEGPDIEFEFVTDTIFCTDGTIDVTLTANNVGTIPVDSWEWTNPTGMVFSTDQNTILDNPGEDASGEYCIYATSTNGCVTKVCDTIIITSASSIDTPTIDSNCDGFVCVGETCTLFGIFSGSDIDSVLWTSSSPMGGLPLDPTTNQVDITPTQNGIYTYTFTIYKNGCTSDVSINMNVSSAAQVEEDNYEVEFNGSILMDVTENDIIPGLLPGLFYINVTSDVNNGTLTNNEDGTFSYTPNEGFFGTDQFIYEICLQCDVEVCVWAIVNINVISEECLIPTVLTPNGDGLNDTWKITCIEDNPENEVQVYNRWGDIVFEAAPYNNDWMGTYNDKDLPDGTYYYIFKTNPNDTDPQKGSLTIMR